LCWCYGSPVTRAPVLSSLCSPVLSRFFRRRNCQQPLLVHLQGVDPMLAGTVLLESLSPDSGCLFLWTWARFLNPLRFCFPPCSPESAGRCFRACPEVPCPTPARAIAMDINPSWVLAEMLFHSASFLSPSPRFWRIGEPPPLQDRLFTAFR